MFETKAKEMQGRLFHRFSIWQLKTTEFERKNLGYAAKSGISGASFLKEKGPSNLVCTMLIGGSFFLVCLVASGSQESGQQIVPSGSPLTGFPDLKRQWRKP